MEAAGAKAIIVQANVGDETAVDRIFARCEQELGTATILVNSAGVDAGGVCVADMKTESWEAALRTNLTGPFLTCRRFVQALRTAKRPGKIVNVTSVHQEIPRAGAAEYDASKGGLRNLTTTLALELAPDKINVNALAPGMVLTPMNQKAIDDPKVLEEQVQSIPWKRAAKPEEVARLAVYLVSADADYVTGATFVIDGGLSLNWGRAHERIYCGADRAADYRAFGRAFGDVYPQPVCLAGGGEYPILLRLVPRRDDHPAEKISRVYLGASENGLRFTMGDVPVIAPGLEEDRDGCEDPTLATVGGKVFVYYSGWNEAEKRGQMLLTAGPDAAHLEKQGVKLPSTQEFANPKEATLVPLADGTWRLFFEYAGEGASKIGLASAPQVDGPWTVLEPPFAARPGGWDGWHLSPGPMLMTDPGAAGDVLQRRDPEDALAHRLDRV